MNVTPNLRLNKPDRGEAWADALNENVNKIDSAIGNQNAAIDSIPESYRYTGTFNGTTGSVITLPKSVDAVNEYCAKVTPTSRTTAIGDIYITKTVSDITVHCSESNSADNFEAVIYYHGDVSSFGGSMYRRYYASPDSSIADHADSNVAGSIANMVGTIGTSPAVLVLPGNGAYTIDSDIDFSDRPDLFLLFDSGAVLARNTGDEVVTAYSPANIIAPGNQNLTNSNMLVFAKPGKVYAEWFGGDIQYAIDSLPAEGGRVLLLGDTYEIGSTGIIIDKSGITLQSICNNFVKGSRIIYTGTGAALTVGANGQITYNVKLFDLNVSADGDAVSGADAVGIKMLNTHYCVIHEISVIDFIAGKGIWWTSDAYPQFGATCEMRNCQIHDCMICVDLTGADGFAKMNHLIVNGGFFSSNGQTSAGCIAFNIHTYSDSTIITGVDIENAETGIYVDGANCRMLAPRFEQCGTAIDVGASGYWTTIVGAQYSIVDVEVNDRGFETYQLDFNASKNEGISNAIPNGGFESWANGENAAPDKWYLGGTGSVSSDTVEHVGGNKAARLTNEEGQATSIYISLTNDIDRFLGKWVRASVMCKTMTADNGRLRIVSDAATGGHLPSAPGYSDYHCGDGSWEMLTTYTFIESTATYFEIHLQALAASSYAIFDNVMVCEGKRPIAYIPRIEEKIEETLSVDQSVADVNVYLTKLDASSGTLYTYIGNGHQIGQQHRYVLIDASNNAYVQMFTDETSTPEVFTFSAVGHYLVIEWNGSYWVTVAMSGVTV
jgi:hypothetical protein